MTDNSQGRPLRGKKLLVAGIGVGTLTFLTCGFFPGCNLLPPPSCEPGECQPLPDLSASDGGVDLGRADASGSSDAGRD